MHDSASVRPAHARGDRPASAFWATCKGMDFGELRGFIDDSLRGLPGPGPDDRPSSEDEFSDLLVLLREKVDEWRPPPVLRDPGRPPAFPGFEPSERLLALREERSRLTRAPRAARGSPEATKRSIRKLPRKLELSDREIAALEESEKEEHARRRDAHLRSYREAKSAYDASVRRRREAAKRHRDLGPRRAEIVERVGRDIERAFGIGGLSPTARRLPWRILPPGELSLDAVLVHYDRLGRTHPHIRYDPRRIRKALSLGPNGWYEGLDEFDGYFVFTFPRTEKVLLECPVYGNAIYVLGPEWKRLSRMNKGELLASSSATKIPHRGEWFARAKLALGPR